MSLLAASCSGAAAVAPSEPSSVFAVLCCSGSDFASVSVEAAVGSAAAWAAGQLVAPSVEEAAAAVAAAVVRVAAAVVDSVWTVHLGCEV